MESIILEVSQDASYNFFSLYHTLGKLQKKIWQIACWFCKKNPVSFPLQNTIARLVKCSRKHVNRTLSLFQLHGWISLKSRGAKHSKVLTIPPHLLMLDLSNGKYFRRMEVTSRVTHISSMNEENKNTGFSHARSYKSTHPPAQIPHHLRGLKISPKNLRKLSLFSESIYFQALEICKNKAKKGWKPKNEEDYFVGTVFNVAKKCGFKPDWKHYYQNC